MHNIISLLASNIGPMLAQYGAQYWAILGTILLQCWQRYTTTILANIVDQYWANVGHEYWTDIDKRRCAILAQYWAQYCPNVGNATQRQYWPILLTNIGPILCPILSQYCAQYCANIGPILLASRDMILCMILFCLFTIVNFYV